MHKARKPKAPKPEAVESFEKQLWIAAGRLRKYITAFVHKHAGLSLVFLKRVSDNFEVRSGEMNASVRDIQ